MTIKAIVLGVAAATVALPALAQQEGNWMVRARAVNLDMKNTSSAGSGATVSTTKLGNVAITGAILPANAIQASDKTIPEVDITYFFTKNIAAELILTYPQKHDVRITSGALAESIGSFKHLPPTLTLQYHFLPEGQIRPYVGVGVNYTRISSVNLQSNVAGVGLSLNSSSVGGALQAGVDVKLSKQLFLNFDIKKIYIGTDVMAGGSKISSLKLDPLAVGVGLGWRF